MSSISLVVAPSGYRTDRQTHIHTDRQTDRQRDTYRHTDRENREKVVNSTEIQTAVFQHLYV